GGPRAGWAPIVRVYPAGAGSPVSCSGLLPSVQTNCASSVIANASNASPCVSQNSAFAGVSFIVRPLPPPQFHPTTTSRSGSRQGTGLNTVPSRMLKIAVVPPIPRPSVSTATNVNAGERSNVRPPDELPGTHPSRSPPVIRSHGYHRGARFRPRRYARPQGGRSRSTDGAVRG